MIPQCTSASNLFDLDLRGDKNDNSRRGGSIGICKGVVILGPFKYLFKSFRHTLKCLSRDLFQIDSVKQVLKLTLQTDRSTDARSTLPKSRKFARAQITKLKFIYTMHFTAFGEGSAELC